MQDHERASATEWLRRARGAMSQDALAADITARTGWSITRDRYSKYESGALPFGRSVLGHFVDYWAGRGVPGPDLTPPPPVLSLEERAVLAAERQASAIERIADYLTGPQAGQADSPARALFEMLTVFQASHSASPRPTDDLATSAGQ